MRATTRFGRLAVLLSAALLWFSAAPPAQAANNLALPTIPLTVINNSGSTSNLYVFIVGQVMTKGGAYYYVSDTSGNLTAIAEMGYTALGLNVGTAQKAALVVPQMTSTRIYVSFQKQIQIEAGSNLVPSQPWGWASTDPNYPTVFDWVEYTWTNLGGGRSSLNSNLTQVDMFGIALLATLNGTNSPTSATPLTLSAGFSATNARQTIFSALNTAGSPWSDLLVANASGTVLRAIAPWHDATFPSDYLDDYIDDVYSKYQKTPLTALAIDKTFTARATRNSLVFKYGAGKTAMSIAFPKPSSYGVFSGNVLPVPAPAPTAPAAPYAARLQSMLQGGFLRTNLLVNTNLSACKTAQFYVNAPIDQYSNIMHQNAYDHLAYGFSADDQCNQSSDITVFNPTSMSVTVQPLTNPPSKRLGKDRRRRPRLGVR